MNLDPAWIRIRIEQTVDPDPDLDTINPDPHHWSNGLGFRNLYHSQVLNINGFDVMV